MTKPLRRNSLAWILVPGLHLTTEKMKAAKIFLLLPLPGVPYGFAGNSSVVLKDENNEVAAKVSATEGKIHIPSASITVSASFPAGYSDGYQIGLYVSASSSGNVCYLYTWKSTETDKPPAETEKETEKPEESREIWLSGVVGDIENRPMPRLKITFEVYYDAASFDSAGSPSLIINTYTDIKGRIFEEIKIPENQETEIGILVKASLNCILADDNESYYLVNMKHDTSQDNISVASFLRVDPNQGQYKNSSVIPVARLFSFYYLCVDAWSFNPQTGDEDFFWSNLPDSYELAAGSYLYNLLWDAQFYSSVILDEGTALKNASLRVETFWRRPDGSNLPAVAHYHPQNSSDGIIRLTEDESKINDAARYTILHEYGHHFDWITNGDQFRAVSLLPADAVNINHGGYMNSNTADSFMEGFATAFAALVQTYRKDNNPHLAGWIDLSSPGNYIAWTNNGKDEELAIALLLYQISLEFSDKRDFWHVLKPNLADFYSYYQALETKVQADEAKLTRLKSLAKGGGLYKMPFGNGIYDKGESFLDKIPPGDSAGNGVYDAGEIFADLMFAVDDYGWIRQDVPLRENSQELVLGQSADASRNRRTIEKLANSFIYFENLLVDQVLVSTISDDKEAVKILMPVEDNKVYLHLTSREQSGRVEISVPGGEIIYTGDIAGLQERLDWTTGQNTPLDTVKVGTITTVNPDLWPMPAYGDTKAQELLELPTKRQIRKYNNQAVLQSKDVDKETSLTYLADLEHKRIPTRTARIMQGVLIAFIVILLIVIITTTIMLARRRRQTGQYSPVEYSGSTSVPDESQIRFCMYCGIANDKNNSFCQNCGKKTWS